MPVAHAIAVVLLASLVQLPSVAGEGDAAGLLKSWS